MCVILYVLVMWTALIAAGVGLFKSGLDYFEGKKKAKQKAVLQNIGHYNQQLQQYWKLHDFDAVSGITTDAQAPTYSGDTLDYNRNSRGYVTSSSGTVGLDSTAALPTNTSDIAANAIAGGVSTGLSLYSAISSFKASKPTATTTNNTKS